MKLTKEQQKALKALWERSQPENRPPYLHFRRMVYPELGSRDTAMIHWAGMVVGIEPDGYTHT